MRASLYCVPDISHMRLEDAPRDVLDRIVSNDEYLDVDEALWRLDKLFELRIENMVPYMVTHMRIEQNRLYDQLMEVANLPQQFMLDVIDDPRKILEFTMQENS